ncbi:helix-turn-helix domain-containing protein [Streptomyces zhihengii]
MAANVRWHRERTGLSTYDLAKKLTAADRPISASAIGKLERSERRVDVGDLVALAAVLNIPPSTLLLPRTVSGDVELTGVGKVNGKKAWRWMQGREPLRYPDDVVGAEARSQFLAMWLMASTPQGVGFDLTTQEGQQSLLTALKDGAWGTVTKGRARWRECGLRTGRRMPSTGRP